jgi:hypothetical protein
MLHPVSGSVEFDTLEPEAQETATMFFELHLHTNNGVID